jgi:hypothetical protein
MPKAALIVGLTLALGAGAVVTALVTGSDGNRAQVEALTSPGNEPTLGDFLLDVSYYNVERVTISDNSFRVIRRNGEHYGFGRFDRNGREFLLELVPALRNEGVIVKADRRALAGALGRRLFEGR